MGIRHTLTSSFDSMPESSAWRDVSLPSISFHSGGSVEVDEVDEIGMDNVDVVNDSVNDVAVEVENDGAPVEVE